MERALTIQWALMQIASLTGGADDLELERDEFDASRIGSDCVYCRIGSSRRRRKVDGSLGVFLV